MTPMVSVVMGVFNAGDVLTASVDSILSQRSVDLEFIIVNDGSTDETKGYLDELARTDVRVRVIHQENQGLTVALISGCRVARGKYIARQDAGDNSNPNRLMKQVARLARESEAVVCSSYAEFTGPRGEYLYTSGRNEAELDTTRHSVEKNNMGPSNHGSVIMRREAYEAVGGYRPQFYFAQDTDLWSRLLEQGRHTVVPEVLYRTRFEPSSISGSYAREQRRLAELIRQAGEARRGGRDESPILRAAAQIRPHRQVGNWWRQAAGAYFIGSCLLTKNPSRARDYFLEAVSHNPFHWKAWVRLAGLHWRAEKITQ